MRKALICIDFIEEIVGEEGKLAGKGYRLFAKDHDTLHHVHVLQESFRLENAEVIHVAIAFENDYSDQPRHSPLFGKAHEFDALKKGTMATSFLFNVAPKENEKVFIKNRVSAFYGTGLDEYLKSQAITHVTICGVSTDLAVESAVRDAHDRDYIVTVIESCCAAASLEDHQNAIQTMKKIAIVE